MKLSSVKKYSVLGSQGQRIVLGSMLTLFLLGCGKTDSIPENTEISSAQSSRGGFEQLFKELQAETPNNRTINIVFHGNSVPAGYHRTPEVRPFDSYPFMVFQGLKERFPNAVINCITSAIEGEDSVKGVRRFNRDVLPHRPDLIFIDYGINDSLFKRDAVEKAWREMILSAKEHQIPVILLTPAGAGDPKLEYPIDSVNIRADVIRELARKHDVPLVDVYARWKAVIKAGTPQKELMSAVKHPNRQGHSIIAQEILSVLDEKRKQQAKTSSQPVPNPEAPGGS
jgi:acyl-CoA thioesterase I